MKQLALPLCLLLFPILPLAGPAFGDQEVTLTGSFVWARTDGDRTGDLEAVFTPSEEHDWTVAFHFVWEDKDHVYLGTADGNLETGTLRGTAEHLAEDRVITFRFEGEFDEGTFQGSHGWLKDDGTLEHGGTLTLSR